MPENNSEKHLRLKLRACLLRLNTMKYTIYIFLFALLTSCANKVELDFEDKWILLNTNHQGEDINVRSLHSLETTYDLDGEVYEAIKFNIRDSTVTIPGLEDENLKFSYSPETGRLKFYDKDLSQTAPGKNPENFYLESFDVSKSKRTGIITLNSDQTHIRVLPVKTMIEKSLNQFMNN